ADGRDEPRRDARADGRDPRLPRPRDHDHPDRAQARRGDGRLRPRRRSRSRREDRGGRAGPRTERRARDRGLPGPAAPRGMKASGGVLLDFCDVHTHYGSLHVLKGVSYEIHEGEIVSLLGGNASGKSTTLKTVLGLVRPKEGAVLFRGQPIHTLRTSGIVRRGIAPVPEGRRVFPKMTVLENLEMGRYSRRHEPGWEAELERVYGLFPLLKERRNQHAGTLSGGEQQMLAIGRALMTRPTLLCMDEPSMGLSPGYVEQVFDI